jgi:hypothetical protein
LQLQAQYEKIGAHIHWQADVRKAEEEHVKYPTLFNGFLEKMRMKQTIYTSQQNARRLVAHAVHHPQRTRESDCNVSFLRADD